MGGIACDAFHVRVVAVRPESGHAIPHSVVLPCGPALLWYRYGGLLWHTRTTAVLAVLRSILPQHAAAARLMYFSACCRSVPFGAWSISLSSVTCPMSHHTHISGIDV